MRHRFTALASAAVLVAGAALSAGAAQAAPSGHKAATRFSEIDLVSDMQGRAKLRDPKLVNPWGLAIGPVAALWSANQGTGSSTFYVGGSGGAIKIPIDVAAEGGLPTGQVYNDTLGFAVKGLPAMFMFASLSGHITGWNTLTGGAAPSVAQNPNAHYTGLALVHGASGPFLLASDFAARRIDAYDKSFKSLTLPKGAFRDPAIPGGYGPFNVTTVGGQVYVAYAKIGPTGRAEPGAGLGFVDAYDTAGRRKLRFASRGALNAPWAVVAAPASFGTFAGDILVGGFGDGVINAYDVTGRWKGMLKNKAGKAIVLPGLWGLVQGNLIAGGTDALWFAAGIGHEKHGLLGLIKP